MENLKRDILVGVAASLATALILFLFGAFRIELEKEQRDRVVVDLVENDIFLALLRNDLKSDPEFREAVKGDKGEQGQVGYIDPAEVAQEMDVGIWPDDGFCVLKNGNCPPGFRVGEGYLRALVMYRGKPPYLKADSLGDSKISLHGHGRTTDAQDSHGELFLSVCCKEASP